MSGSLLLLPVCSKSFLACCSLLFFIGSSFFLFEMETWILKLYQTQIAPALNTINKYTKIRSKANRGTSNKVVLCPVPQNPSRECSLPQTRSMTSGRVEDRNGHWTTRTKLRRPPKPPVQVLLLHCFRLEMRLYFAAR